MQLSFLLKKSVYRLDLTAHSVFPSYFSRSSHLSPAIIIVIASPGCAPGLCSEFPPSLCQSTLAAAAAVGLSGVSAHSHSFVLLFQTLKGLNLHPLLVTLCPTSGREGSPI